MDTTGRHLLVEYRGCSPEALNDIERIQKLMESAAKAAGMTIVTSVFKAFQPQGVTGVVVLEESHLSIHTWPEKGYAAVDCYTCGVGDPARCNEVLMDGLRAQKIEVIRVERGLDPASTGTCMNVLRHYTQG